MPNLRSPLRCTALAAALSLACAAGAGAQSLLERPPNLSADWVGNGGQLYFNFLHRFTSSPAPERKVSNFPTFTLAAGLPYRTLLGVHYATNSQLAPRYPNEWEFFGRWKPISQDAGAPLDLGGEVAYNLAAEGVDGEVSLARRQGPVRLIGVARILSDPFSAGDRRYALGGGATLRLSQYLALAGDATTLLERRDGEKVAWSAGVQVAIPHTPHTLSLQAANTNTYTLQGLSRGEDRVRYGFEFTIPLTLARWLGSRAVAVPAAAPPPPTVAAAPSAPPPPSAAAAPADSTAAPEAAAENAPAPVNGKVVKAGMRNLAFVPARIEIEAGTTVEWTNHDPLAHSVTAADGSFNSGLIEPGKSWSHTFSTPGTYPFSCTPHPFMKGVVVVK